MEVFGGICKLLEVLPNVCVEALVDGSSWKLPLPPPPTTTVQVSM